MGTTQGSRISVSRTLLILGAILFAPMVLAEKGQWVSVSDGVIAQLQKDGKKVGYPGLTAGVAVDPSSGDLYVVVCDQGLWKSTDKGETFTRVDGGKIGGRCETGFALNFDPKGKRMACFMIYGACGNSLDSGEHWRGWKTNHLDFGAVDWEATGDTLLATRHESGGVLCLSADGGQTWKNLGTEGPDKKINKEDRDYTMLGMFDAESLLASRGDGILRSADRGKTWTSVSDAKLVGAVMSVHNGIGYWMSDKGVLRTTDKGKTWTMAWPIRAVFGPWFSADDHRIVVVGKEGFSESTDGGQTWKPAAPLPPGFNANLVGPNYAWDSIHDLFYASSMGRHTYRFER